MLKKMKKAFTITELVIVIAVIAILAAVLIPTFTTVVNNANESAAMQEAKSSWTGYSAEIIVNTQAEDQDYLFVNGDYVFVVENGAFNVDPITAIKANEVAADKTVEINGINYIIGNAISSEAISTGTTAYPLTEA